MKIGIMVHSQTGNTLRVAEKIQERLNKEGHSAELKKIIPFRESDPRPADVRFQAKPSVEGYEVLIFAAPVWAFSLSTVMRAFLEQMEMQGKPIVLGFVTHAFPLPWMGGSRAIRQMESLCQAKGLRIVGAGIINWSRKDRENQILDLTGQFVKALAKEGDAL